MTPFIQFLLFPLFVKFILGIIPLLIWIKYILIKDRVKGIRLIPNKTVYITILYVKMEQFFYEVFLLYSKHRRAKKLSWIYAGRIVHTLPSLRCARTQVYCVGLLPYCLSTLQRAALPLILAVSVLNNATQPITAKHHNFLDSPNAILLSVAIWQLFG